MKVVQTVFGKFHHFHLARQLHKRGMLQTIFSSYPRKKLLNEQIPPEKIHTFPYIHLLWFANQRYGKRDGKLSRDLSWWLALTLDGHVARRLPPCDVFIGISGSGLKTGQTAQKRGGFYICDRGSTHIRYADRIMREEFARWGQEFPGVDARHLGREDQEYAAADVITVPSECTRRSFITMGVPAEKMRKVVYGADLSRFSKTADPPKETFDVLFAGQISFRKGIPYLLEGFARFKHPNKRLRIAGSMLPEIERYLQGKQLENVEFLGIQRYPQLKELMSRSHVLVLPSVEEGLALVQGEAMACGCPIISSENTGGEDLFTAGQEGFIVPIRDPQAIADRLEQLAQDPDLRDRMSEAALRRVTGIGGWDTYGADYVRVLEALVCGEQRLEEAR